jgi:hypothetical protein
VLYCASTERGGYNMNAMQLKDCYDVIFFTEETAKDFPDFLVS